MAWKYLILLGVLVEAELKTSKLKALDQILVKQDALDADKVNGQLTQVADECGFCSPSPDASLQDLKKIESFNSKLVSKAITDYTPFAQHYGQKVNAEWESKAMKAQELCKQADLSMDPFKRAKLAMCAWGGILMRQRECCNMPGPPYCISSTKSQGGRAFVLILALFIAGMGVLLGKFCPGSFFVPSLVFVSPPGPPDAAPRNASIVVDESSGGSARVWGKRRELRKKLLQIWQRCTMVQLAHVETDPALNDQLVPVDPVLNTKIPTIVEVFARLCENWDFQEHSVLNIFEFFISHLRSHCAALKDQGMEERCGHDDNFGLLGHALESMEQSLLFGYSEWQSALQTIIQVTGSAASGIKDRMEVIAMYLLVWGESGNLRFMPELIYFLSWILLHSEPPNAESLLRSSRGKSNDFLVQVVRPLYNKVFDEHHDGVPVRDGKDRKQLRKDYDRYLPADAANYDDWNELFQDVERLVEALPFLKVIEPSQLYAQLTSVDWQEILHNAKVKTHRELHSWWGVFAATHRLWFLHLLLFLLCMFAVSEKNYPYGRGWKVLLAGNDMATCLSCVLMVVPVHIVAWKMGCWFTTGSALRRCRRCREVLEPLFWSGLVLSSCVTFIWVRYVDATGSSAWSSQILGTTVAWPIALHLFVCCLGTFSILFQPFQNGQGLSQVISASTGTKLLRWVFWIMVMGTKLWASYHGILATEKAIRELKISRPGHETLEDLPKIAFGPNWDKDMIQWLAIWGTAFVCFVADTQFWFVVGCTILGFLQGCAERGWALKTFIQEDAIAKVAKRFSRRVLMSEWKTLNQMQRQELLRKPSISLTPMEAKDQDYSLPESSENQTMSDYFPAVWDYIIDFMRCEDKLDASAAAQLKFSGTVALSSPMPRDAPPWQALQRLCEKQLQVPVSVWPPSIFSEMRYGQRLIERHTGIIPSDSWPSNSEVVWRLNAFARNLGSNYLPRPYLTPYVPGITVLIPHYEEAILMQRKDLYKRQRERTPEENQRDEVSLMARYEKRYHDDFVHFTNRMKSQQADWPDYGTNWEAYQDEHWKHICFWASMRSQTFWRTVEGCMLYLPALERFHEMVKDIHGEKLLGWDATAVFTCMGSMQRYPDFKPHELDHAEQLLQRFPRSFQIAYIDYEAKDPLSQRDGVHPKQDRRYFSCLIDSSCRPLGQNRRRPRFRVELPGFPILGDGKGDNQNTSIPFTRGTIVQTVDSNQGAYFEQMLLLPCHLGEFRCTDGSGPLGAYIVGFPEHITSDIGSIGDSAAGAELAFGTVLQRTYSILGARMHYGHPDTMNKEYMMQQGGVSKATKTLNLSEDIFAGMDFTLRGGRRKIKHCEYFHMGKGRDLGFNTVNGFFSKLSGGTGEQLLTRQMSRLGLELGLPEFLTFYYAHAGYYITQFQLSKCIPLLDFVWLVLVLDGPEQNFPSMDAKEHAVSGATIMAKMLTTQFGWLMPFFLLAQTAPLFLQMWWEGHVFSAISRVGKQMLTLAPLHFIFQAKVIGMNIVRDITIGGAKYKGTGRQLPTERGGFIELFTAYAVLAFYDGAQLFLSTMLAVGAGGLKVDSKMVVAMRWWMLAVSLTICSWLLAPFIFNPSQFTCEGFYEDFTNYCHFFFQTGGEAWKSFYNERLCSDKPLRASSVEVLKRALFLGCLYTVANQKLHMLTVIFNGGQLRRIVMLIMPPFIGTIICIGLLRVAAWLLRHLGHEAVRVRISTMEFNGSPMQREILRTRAQTHTVRSRDGKDLTESLKQVEAAPEIPEEDFPVSFTERQPPNPSWGKRAFEAFHYQADDRITTISLPESAELSELWLEDWRQAFRNYCRDEKLLEPLAYEVRSREGQLLGPRSRLRREDFPLSIAREKELKLWLGMILVMVLVPVETYLELWKFYSMGWYKTLVIGILLKISILCVVMEFIECCLHIKNGFAKSGCVALRGCLYGLRSAIKTWLYSHRMAQDFFVSSLILLILSIPTAFDGLRKKCCGCENCGLHNMLVYRDPGGIHKRQENRLERPWAEMRGPIPAAD